MPKLQRPSHQWMSNCRNVNNLSKGQSIEDLDRSREVETVRLQEARIRCNVCNKKPRVPAPLPVASDVRSVALQNIASQLQAKSEGGGNGWRHPGESIEERTGPTRNTRQWRNSSSGWTLANPTCALPSKLAEGASQLMGLLAAMLAEERHS